MSEYKYLAAEQAFKTYGKTYGKSYADYIEAHTAELVAKGYLTDEEAQRSLGEALMGNDGE